MITPKARNAKPTKDAASTKYLPSSRKKEPVPCGGSLSPALIVRSWTWIWPCSGAAAPRTAERRRVKQCAVHTRAAGASLDGGTHSPSAQLPAAATAMATAVYSGEAPQGIRCRKAKARAQGIAAREPNWIFERISPERGPWKHMYTSVHVELSPGQYVHLRTIAFIYFSR